MTTRIWLKLALASAALGLAVLLAASAAKAWIQWAEEAPDYPVEIPLAADKTLGVNADLSRYSTANRSDALAAMEARGLHWLRHRFPWNAIEPEQGAYDWAVWDEIVEGATRHNLTLIAVLDGTPAWARAGQDSRNPLAPPAQVRDFGAFVAAFVTRYGDQIDYYQIWDEPNIAPHWGAREIEPGDYASLLREGAIQIRAINPGAVILSAALAPNIERGGANMSEVLFLDALYQHGGAEWFDVLAVQPYPFDVSIGAAPSAGQLNWRRIELLREVMRSHGDEATAVWAVSFGLADASSDLIVEALHKAREDWPWMGPMLWAAWAPSDTHGAYALCDNRGEWRPAYTALREVAADAALAWPGSYPANHSSGYYEGRWRVTESGADIGGSGDRLTIRFRGTGLRLSVRRGDYRAFLFVTVDGQAANALPIDDEGRAYVVLYDPLLATESVVLASGLSPGEHVAEIVAERGWEQWAIAGWSVSGAPPRAFPWLPVGLCLASLATLGLTLYAFGPYRVQLLDALFLLVARYRSLDERVVLAIVAALAILLYAVEGTAFSLAAMGLMGLLLVLKPQSGLPVIALALPFYQPGKPMLGKTFSMVEILTLLTVVGYVVSWGLRSLGVRRLRARSHSQSLREFVSSLTALDWGVAALVVLGALSFVWSEHLRVAVREYRTVILEAALFYGLLRILVKEPRAAWRIADAWLLGAALIGLVGIGQWFFGQDVITAEGVWRVRGFYGSPNNLALYLGRLIPLGVAVVAFWEPPTGQAGGRCIHGRRWLYALASAIMIVAILLTYSRGAWLLGVPASLLFLAAMRGRRTFFAAIGVLLVVLMALVLLVGPGRLTSLLDTTEGTTFFRLRLWQSSWAMIQDHPILGVGLDNFLYHYRTRYVLPAAWEEFNLSHPHNLILDFWLRLGLPGLAVLGVLLVAFFRRGWQVFKRRWPGTIERMAALGLMAGMVNFVAHGLVDNAFFLVDLSFACMLMLALVQISDNY